MLTLAGGVLSLEVSDNGRGLSSEDLAKARSFGIRGLRERAGTVGGWVDLSSSGSGTTLILSVPLEIVDETEDSAHLELSDRDPYDPTSWGDL
jgi:glucose-6-phosphate-specific signal transduction histidine kinase